MMKDFSARNLSAALCVAAAVTASPSFAGGSCPPDINNDSTVNVSDLLIVIDEWGACSGSCPADIAPGSGDGMVNAPDTFAVLDGWGDCASTNPPPLTPSGPITLGNGATTVANKAITGTWGILGNNNTHVTLLTVTNCTINVAGAGIYAAPCDEAIVTDTHIVSNGQPDPYSVRGTFHRWTSRDCSFHGDKAWRLYGLTGGSSTRDEFTGERLLCGGGSANEWENPQDFDNFTFRDGSIDVWSVEIHAASNNIVFHNMDFTGTDHVSIHGPAHHITFEHCTRNGQLLTQGDAGSGNSHFIRLYNNPSNIHVTP